MKLGRTPRLAFGTSLELYTLSSPRLEFRPPGSRGRLNDLAHCSFVLTVALDCLPAMFARARLGAFRRRGYHARCRSEAASRPLRRILSIADGCVVGTAFLVRQRSWTRKARARQRNESRQGMHPLIELTGSEKTVQKNSHASIASESHLRTGHRRCPVGWVCCDRTRLPSGGESQPGRRVDIRL